MPKTTVVLAMIVAAAAWLSVVGAVSAATETHMDQAPMDGVPGEPPALGAPLAVPQFDPSQGVLQSVDVTFELTLEGSMSATNTQTAAALVDMTLTLLGRLHEGQLVCPVAGQLISADASVTELDVAVAGGATVSFPDVAGFDSQGAALTEPGDLVPYVGPGTVDFTACFLSGISALGAGSGNLDLSFTANALAKVTVEYTFVETGIDIEKSTNGQDADLPTGPLVPVGDPVNWDYLVTNTGEATINDIVVTDDQGVAVACPADTLAAAASMTCTGAGAAAMGQYANVGMVVGQPVDDDGAPLGPTVTDSDPSHYFGYFAAIAIEKSTNGEDADDPTGPSIPTGQPVNWLYEVTNIGNVPLIDVTVIDDQGVAVSCPATTLAPGATMDCTASGVAVAGQYANLGTVTGQPVDFAPDPQSLGALVSDEDPSHYIGSAECIPKKKHKKSKKDDDYKPKGTKYVKIDKTIYVVVWKLKKRFVVVDGDRYSVKTREGRRPFVKIDGKKYGVKTLKRSRKLALGGPPPVCPHDDKKDKPKDAKGKGEAGGKGGGTYVKPTAPPKSGGTKVDAIAEPGVMPGGEEITCVGPRYYWLKGDGKRSGAWTQIGPDGKKTRFFASKQSYVKVLRKGSSRPYFRLARAYITAKLNMYRGAPVTAEMERAIAFAERHFSARKASYTNVKRALKAQTATGKKGQVRKIKKLRKKMVRHTATLRDHGGMPTCTT